MLKETQRELDVVKGDNDILIQEVNAIRDSQEQDKKIRLEIEKVSHLFRLDMLMVVLGKAEPAQQQTPGDGEVERAI